MANSLVDADLAKISSADDLRRNELEMTERWLAQGADLAAVESVIVFIEQRPDWHFGIPGKLVKFVENFYHKGYEALLVQSLARTPTLHTLWMLNRVISGEKDAEQKAVYMAVLSRIASDPASEEHLVEKALDYLDYQADP